jgi:hypothetical protein
MYRYTNARATRSLPTRCPGVRRQRLRGAERYGGLIRRRAAPARRKRAPGPQRQERLGASGPRSASACASGTSPCCCVTAPSRTSKPPGSAPCVICVSASVSSRASCAPSSNRWRTTRPWRRIRSAWAGRRRGTPRGDRGSAGGDTVHGARGRRPAEGDRRGGCELRAGYRALCTLLDIVEMRTQLEAGELARQLGHSPRGTRFPGPRHVDGAHEKPRIRKSYCASSPTSGCGGTRCVRTGRCALRALNSRFAASGRGRTGAAPSRSSASRSTCRSCVSKRSSTWLTRWRRRSVSPVSASPVSRRLIPGLRSANVSSSSSMCCCAPGPRLLLQDQRNALEQGFFDELDEAIEHLRLARKVPIERGLGYADLGASRAVVMRSPGLSSSICARASRICWRRCEFLGMHRRGSVSGGKLHPSDCPAPGNRQPTLPRRNGA